MIKRLLSFAFCLLPLQAAAQGRLMVTVNDQSGAIIRDAKVTVIGTDDATKGAPLAPVMTSGVGLATLENLAPGRYTIQAEFEGFETITVKDFRVRAGDNRRAITLPIKKVSADMTVGRDKQAAALDPLGNAFSTVLTREQIAALPDDPDEMEQMLKAMAPPGSTIRVDGFSGGKLPPKSQIRSIRLPRMDMFAAQNHGGINGLMFIDITTQPGLGPLRGSTDFTFRNDALNARNPFAATKGNEGLQQYGGSLSGSLVPNKVSFSMSAQGAMQHDTGNLLAALADGSRLAQPVFQPTDRHNVTGSLTSAVGRDHTMRINFQRNAFTRNNQGVGGFDLPDRAYTSQSSDSFVRFSESGPVSRRFFSESRAQVRWTGSESRSLTEAPTIRVLDAFTSGGAQQKGGRHTLEFEAATDLDYVRGRHSMRTGILLEGGRYHSDDFSNYLGTFTFSSLAAYQAGTPLSYTKRVGDPDVRYGNVQAGMYLQDDYRVARSVMLSYGLRYEAQNLLGDQNNFSPRLSTTWAPFKSGKTTIRAGFGSFTDWFASSTYEQSLRVDGERQRELNIINPTYPDISQQSGTTPPTNKYLLNPDLTLPESLGANLGFDQMLAPTFRVNMTYTYRRGSHMLRGRNLNALVNGVRPDAAFSNVIEVENDAAQRGHTLNVGMNLAKLEWHRTFFFVNYSLASSETNTTGAFSIPANGDDLTTEWGPMTPRHRFNVAFNTMPITDLGVSLNLRAQSGTPYTLTTGVDGNADGVFNDRPEGVGRNTLVTDGQWDLGLRVSYAIGFGQRAAAAGGPMGQMIINVGGGGGGMPGAMGLGGADNKRYRVEFYASAQNVTNHPNYVGYSGVMTSVFFRQPTNVLNPRKVEIGARFGF